MNYGAPFHDAMDAHRRGLIVTALRQCAGNVTEAARQLGLTRTYLCRLKREYALDRAPYTGPYTAKRADHGVNLDEAHALAAHVGRALRLADRLEQDGLARDEAGALAILLEHGEGPRRFQVVQP